MKGVVHSRSVDACTSGVCPSIKWRLREVDIAVETTVADTKLVVGFEVRGGTSAPLDVVDVEGVVEKYRHLVDKTVIVWRSGFSAAAVAHCVRNGADAVPFSDAIALDCGAL